MQDMDGLKYLYSSEEGSSNESVSIAVDLDPEEDYVGPEVSCPGMNETIDYNVYPNFGITRCNNRETTRFLHADFGVDGTSKKRRGKMATTPKDEFDGSNASTKMKGDKKLAGKASITPGKLFNSPQWNGQNYSTISDCFRGRGGRGGISEDKEG